MQSLEYSDEMENSATTCGKLKEPESDCTKLRALLLFLLLWQAMFKVTDRAIVLLLKFFKLFLSGIAKMMQAEVLINFAKIIPETLYMIRKNLGLQREGFIKYAVCPKCKTLFNFNECVRQRPNGEVVSAKCSHVSYPRHPHQAQKEAMWFPSNENYEVKSRKDILVS